FSRNTVGRQEKAAGAHDHVLGVDSAEREKQLRLLVQPRTDTVERGCNVLAHVSPIRAAARQPDLLWFGKQPLTLPAYPVHHAFGETALQQLDHAVDAAGAVAADRLPSRHRDPADGDLVGVEFGTANLERYSDFASRLPRGRTYVRNGSPQAAPQSGVARAGFAPRPSP